MHIWDCFILCITQWRIEGVSAFFFLILDELQIFTWLATFFSRVGCSLGENLTIENSSHLTCSSPVVFSPLLRGMYELKW